MNNIYLWQEKIWHQLNQDNQRMPHALLLHGRAGIGKYHFAVTFSKALLCTDRDQEGLACGKCSSCNWFNENNHPDFRLLTPEQESSPDDDVVSSSKKTKKKTQISVAQIRELSSFLSLTSHRSNGLRIVLINPTEALNLASANALLKMLEEPAEGVVFILVAHQLQRLLPTILSRCQKISMPMPDEAQSLAWLSEQGVQNAKQQLAYLEGSPIKVFDEQLQFSELKEIWRLLSQGKQLEPHLAAPALIAGSAENGIIAMQKWIYDIVAMRLSRQIRYHTEHTKTFQALAEKVHLNRLFDLQKKTDELRKLALHPLNHELQIESLLLDYTKIFST